MNPFNPFFSVTIFIIAFLTGYVIKLNYKSNSTPDKYECISGLRGFLAIAVFIHHSSAWFQSFKTGKWSLLNSNLYSQLGETSVSFFFMITSFLFISKLLDSKEKDFDWQNFFISRIFRVVPMYYVSVVLIVIVVLSITHWQLNVEPPQFLLSILNWLLFTIYETSKINNIGYTSLVNGGVQWSLWYELLFYFSLPLISVFILKIKPKAVYLILGLIFIIFFYNVRDIIGHHIYSFVGGAIAPVLIKYTAFYKKLKDVYLSIAVLICLVLIVQFNTTEGFVCKLLITIVFTLIALGASVFGLLKKLTLRFLGRIGYSTYLLHGILLFSVFNFVMGQDKIRSATPLEYCFVIFSITPALVFISFIGFKFIEKPYMDRGKRVIKKLNLIKR